MITLKKIQDTLNNQNTNQIHSNIRIKPTDYNQIISYGFGELCTDILDLSVYQKENEGYRYLLLVQDIESRFLFVAPMKKKDTETVLHEFKKIEYAFQYPIKSITADKGSEFTNTMFRNYFKNVQLYFKEPEMHNSALSIIDRMCLTIRNLLKRYFTANGNHIWISIINRLIKNINTTENRGINAIPEQVYLGQDTNNQVIRPPPPQLKIGQKVRIRNNVVSFNRKHLSKFSNRVYTISSIDGIGYRLENGRRKYQYSELLVVPEHLKA